MMVKRVGIFAGSFDPIHMGHIDFAKQALEESKLDKIFFLVEPRPRRKQGVRALEHRRNMVQLSIEHQPSFGSILLEQPRFSVAQTMPVLKELFKGAKLHLLMGDDVLNHLADWPHVDDLIKDVCFVIGVRNHSTEEINQILNMLQTTRGLRLKYSLFQASLPKFSSSQVRLSLKHGQQSPGIAPKVLQYIKENGLYRPN